MKASEAKKIALAEVERLNSLEYILESVGKAASNGFVSIEIHKHQAEKFKAQLEEMGYTITAKQQCGPIRNGASIVRNSSGCRTVYQLIWQNPTA